MNDTQEDLTTDDELLRIQGMSDVPQEIGKFTLRPITGSSWSWMLCAKLWNDDIDNIMRTAAYAFIHTQPKNAAQVKVQFFH